MSAEDIAVESNGVPNDQKNDDSLRRKNSLERYRPGAYFNEEREKHRRRGHFGERKLEVKEKEKENKPNGFKKGHRGGGRGGRGGPRRGGGGGDFSNYRNGGGRHDQDEDDQPAPTLEIQASPPPIGNWADDVSDASPEAVSLYFLEIFVGLLTTRLILLLGPSISFFTFA